MKCYRAAGICLTFALFVGQSSAQISQWRTRAPSAPGPASNLDQGSGTGSYAGDSLGLGQPVPLTQTSYSSDDSTPFRFRSVVRGVSPDDDNPRRLPPDNQSAVPMTGPPQIIQVPNSTGSGQLIPVAPTVISEGGTVIPASSCNCGLGSPIVVGDGTIVEDGGCGCSSGGSCCAGSCGLGGSGLFAGGLFSGSHFGGLFGDSGLSWGWSPGVTDGCCNTCCNTCFDGCCYNGNRNTMWFTAEYLLYSFSSPNLPPLVTTGTAGTALPNGSGTTGPALGQPGTTVLVGGDSFNNMLHSGMRFDFGFWIPGCDKLGLDFGFMYLPQTSSTIYEGSGILGRPFFDVTPSNPSSFQNTEAVNGFNGTTGSVSVNYYSRVWGLDGNLRYKLCCGPNFKVDLLAGYRNFNMSEGVNINENLYLNGANNQITDSFGVNNAFNGGQIGIDAEWRFWPRWSIGGQLKLAMGAVHESVSISGSQTNPLFQIGSYAPSGSGVFATSSNIGNYTRDQFAVLPEANLKLGLDVNNNVRLFVAYNVLYLSSAARVGSAIDTTINTNNQYGATPGAPARPAFTFTNGSFFAQGFSAGVDIHW